MHIRWIIYVFCLYSTSCISVVPASYLFEPKISTVSLLIIETDEWIDGLLLNDFLKPVFRTVKLKSFDFIDSRFPNGKMENLQAQVEAQGAKIRAMKEAIKADPASHSKEALDNEIKELTGLKVFIHNSIAI